MSDDQDPAPVEIWLINGGPVPVRLGSRILDDLRLAQCAAQHHAAREAKLQAQLEGQAERKPTYKEVYARYRRRHARNPKVTIREVCDEMGVDYDNIRAAKSRATKREKHHEKRHKRKPK